MAKKESLLISTKGLAISYFKGSSHAVDEFTTISENIKNLKQPELIELKQTVTDLIPATTTNQLHKTNLLNVINLSIVVVEDDKPE